MTVYSHDQSSVQLGSNAAFNHLPLSVDKPLQQDPSDRSSYTTSSSALTYNTIKNDQSLYEKSQHDRQPTDGSELEASSVSMPSTYAGSGTEDDPYVVTFTEDDSDNPYNWSHMRRMMLTLATAIATLVVSFDSSCYAGPAQGLMQYFQINKEILTLGISLYVLGFAIG